MVVAQHSSFLKDISNIGWYISVNGILRIAVPIFLIINGYFFYTVVLYNPNPKQWFKRIFLLYFFWMAFYSYFWFRLTNFDVYNIANLLRIVLIGFHHLWYLPGMIGAAFLVFLLRTTRSSSLFIMATVLFLIGLLLQYIGNYHLIENELIDKIINTLWIYRNFLFFAFPFFALGYLIKKTGIDEAITSKQLILISIVGSTLILMESKFNFDNLVTKEGFDILVSLIILCPCIFMLFLKYEVRTSSKIISQYSTAIYFIHPFFISVLGKFFGFGATFNTAVVTLLSILAGYLLIKLNTKVRIIL